MKKITVSVLLCTLLLSASFPGVQNLSAQNARPDIDENQCVIPFRMVYKLMTIEVTINGITGYLCIDTGIEGLVIRDTYFKGGRTDRAFMSSNGKTVDVGYTPANVQFACLSIDIRSARVMNLDHLIPNQSTRVLGLAGWDVFKGYELRINLQNSVLQLFKLDEKGNRIGREETPVAPLFSIPFRFKGPLPCVQAEIGEREMHLILDTGASVNVMRKTLYSKLSPYSSFLKTVRLREWDNQTSDVPMTEVSGMTLGAVQLESMHTVWYDLSGLNAELGGTSIDGVLGQQLMKQYLLAINFAKLEVSFYHYENVQSGDVVNHDSERTSNE
ncbi:MAG TPA: retropepsin-like aspartic protease [Saprospiraceae bacterium]|nr:retropepsin-like aspartic protease [Saprospiraceae bacterium]